MSHIDMTEEKIPSRATIYHFPRKRGRPKSARPNHDTGTPELIMKRALGETAETLDLCLSRGIITPEQHWSGIHLRWLYTLRHGAPSVRALDPTHLGGIEIKQDDPKWREKREQEYHEAISSLGRHALLTLNLCVYNQRPKFLSLRGPITPKRLAETTEMIASMRQGLDILVKLWGRKTR